MAPSAVVGRGGLEPPTSRLSGVRSNRLSYRPLESLVGTTVNAISAQCLNRNTDPIRFAANERRETETARAPLEVS